jgi:hypothetical protein
MGGLREFGAYAEEYMAAATHLATYRRAREWMEAGVSAETAAAWANLGYLPAEAAPLIAAGVTPQMAGEMDRLADDIAGSPEERAAQLIDRLVAEGVLVDPKRVRRAQLPDDGRP